MSMAMGSDSRESLVRELRENGNHEEADRIEFDERYDAGFSSGVEAGQKLEATKTIWKNPKESLPAEADIVCVLYQHNKEHGQRSVQMMVGVVEFSNDRQYVRVNSEDFTGAGGWCVALFGYEDTSYYELAFAWCHVRDFNFPSWTPHNPHWGPLEK